jgi:hypothetical protein
MNLTGSGFSIGKMKSKTLSPKTDSTARQHLLETNGHSGYYGVKSDAKSLRWLWACELSAIYEKADSAPRRWGLLFLGELRGFYDLVLRCLPFPPKNSESKGGSVGIPG